MRISIFKMKDDKEEMWKEWGKYLTDNKGEVIETLKEENVDMEFSFTFTVGEEKYMAIGMIGDDIKQSTERPLNLMHRAKIGECVVERVSRGEFVYCIENNNS